MLFFKSFFLNKWLHICIMISTFFLFHIWTIFIKYNKMFSAVIDYHRISLLPHNFGKLSFFLITPIMVFFLWKEKKVGNLWLKNMKNFHSECFQWCCYKILKLVKHGLKMEDEWMWSQMQCRLMAEVSKSFSPDKRKINAGFRSVLNQKENRQLLAPIRNKAPVPIAVTRQQAPPRQQEIGWQTKARKKLYRSNTVTGQEFEGFQLCASGQRAACSLLGGYPIPEVYCGATQSTLD